MITVLGMGFVGLTTALGLCEKNQIVYGYDINKEKIEKLKRGEIPFYEPHLKNYLEKHLGGNLKIVNNLESAIENSHIIFFCMGTPSKENGSCNLEYMFNAIDETLKCMKNKPYKVFVIKSTIPPSTTEQEIIPYINNLGFNVGEDLGIVNNPEFLREGHAWNDFMNPDRIIIGERDKKSGDLIEELYQPFHASIFRVSLNTSEFTKYLSNTLLASLISFSNELSMIAKTIGGIDVKEAFKLLHLDKRWSGLPAGMTNYVYPGCGFGGYCLPKDTRALIHQSENYGFTPKLLTDVLEINEQIKEFLICEIIEKINRNEKIGILGLAFKENSDDVRNTPAKEIIELLLNNNFNNIIAYDPVASENFKKNYMLPIQYAKDLESLTSNVNYIVIITPWKEFKDSTTLFRNRIIFDLRYII